MKAEAPEQFLPESFNFPKAWQKKVGKTVTKRQFVVKGGTH